MDYVDREEKCCSLLEVMWDLIKPLALILICPREGTSLVVRWLRLRVASAGDPGSIPGQGTRPHMPQLKIPHAATKIPRAATKTRCSQINK